MEVNLQSPELTESTTQGQWARDSATRTNAGKGNRQLSAGAKQSTKPRTGLVGAEVWQRGSLLELRNLRGERGKPLTGTSYKSSASPSASYFRSKYHPN